MRRSKVKIAHERGNVHRVARPIKGREARELERLARELAGDDEDRKPRKPRRPPGYRHKEGGGVREV